MSLDEKYGQIKDDSEQMLKDGLVIFTDLLEITFRTKDAKKCAQQIYDYCEAHGGQEDVKTKLKALNFALPLLSLMIRTCDDTRKISDEAAQANEDQIEQQIDELGPAGWVKEQLGQRIKEKGRWN